MMTNPARMTCDAFADKLAARLEDELPEGLRHAMDAHAAACVSCGALLEELDALRHDAAALPQLEPSRDLWMGIADRIDARVIPLSTDRVAARPARRSWIRPAVAAAALVIATAGITHLLTRASYEPRAARLAASRPAADPVSPDSSPVGTSAGRATGQDEEFATGASPDAGSGTMRRLASRSGGAAAGAERLMEAAEPVYDREIGKLRTIVRERRSSLDPKTVAVLEQSIAVIDSAIAQSRAALAKDPASGFLAEQLNRSLEKKVELLRTAALLPART
jgi:hypothetical protein